MPSLGLKRRCTKAGKEAYKFHTNRPAYQDFVQTLATACDMRKIKPDLYKELRHKFIVAMMETYTDGVKYGFKNKPEQKEFSFDK